MKAEDLRIGNLILDRKKVISVECHHFQMLNSYHKEDFKPIPLTEEWLLKFGFKDGYFGFSKSVLSLNLKSESVSFSFSKTSLTQIKGVIFPKHVHQLQNLYFALTNEELTIK